MCSRICLVAIAVVFVAACASRGASISAKDPDYRALAHPQPTKPNLSATIRRDDAESDLRLLRYALRAGYIESLYPSPRHEDFEKALMALDEPVPETQTVLNFAEFIGDRLWIAADAHLQLRGDGEEQSVSPRRLREERKPSVGANALIGDCHKTGRAYAWRKLKKAGRQIPVLAFCERLYPPGDRLEAGLESVLDDVMKQKFLVIDLRGVHGGSDYYVDLVAERLLGAKIVGAKDMVREVEARTPEALQMELNQFQLQANSYVLKNEPVPEILTQLVQKYQKLLDESLRPGAPRYEVAESLKQEIPSEPNLGFKGRVYVLIDAVCASACESSLEALELHPHAVTVGENTRGLIHFTMQERLVLPKSQLLVRVPFKYNEYTWFAEKVGHAPMLKTPSGTDALEWLMQQRKSL